MSKVETTVKPAPSFDTPDEAINWMVAHLTREGEQYIDNERFAFLDDALGLAEYSAKESTGCCGSHEEEVLVSGRLSKVGCNFGH